ncbi:MAG: glycosyltransferase [Sphingomonadaceae bacterium]
MGGILYISYTGMAEPLGQSQVISYLERLAGDFEIHLISFEKPDADPQERALAGDRIARAGIGWHPLRYHKRPPSLATFYDVRRGIALGKRLIARHGLSVVHARSYVPALMALALKSASGVRFLFDMRGFWADERADAGLWRRSGPAYRVTKRLERRFLAEADAIVSLSHAAAREIDRMPEPPLAEISVIPTCVDLERFRPMPELRAPVFTLGYVGSVGGWYCFEEVVELFLALKKIRREAQLLVVNRGEHDKVVEHVRRHGLDPGAVELRTARHEQMPGLVNRMSAGIMIARTAYSHLARAPTRLAEYLGCGVPCAANDGIGDVSGLIEKEAVGTVLREFSDTTRRHMAEELVALSQSTGIIERCAAAARRHFSLDEGVARYCGIYRKLNASYGG